jgi:hypothetical protein
VSAPEHPIQIGFKVMNQLPVVYCRLQKGN